MTTFKAVDGYVKPNEVYRYGVMDDDALMVQASALARTDQPCTIIPGHWAERIESGELLTDLDILDVFEAYIENHSPLTIGYTDFGIFLSKHIARKLRGEA